MKVWGWRQAIQKSDLSSTTRLVLLNLSIYMNDIGEGCYPSTKQQSQDTGLSERAVCQHLQIAVEQGFLIKDRHGFGGRAWNRQEYTACYPEGTDLVSAPKPQKALTESKHQKQKGTDVKSVRNAKKALTQDQRDKKQGTDFDDIKALTLTTKGTDAGSARIYNSPKNSPFKINNKSSTQKEGLSIAMYITLQNKIKQGIILNEKQKKYCEEYEKQEMEKIGDCKNTTPPDVQREKIAKDYAWCRRTGVNFNPDRKRYLEAYEKEMGVILNGFENGQKLNA